MKTSALFSLATVVLLLTSSIAADEEYADQWAPPVGSAIPLLEAQDQTGKVRTLEDLRGRNGLLVFFNRSADW